MLCRLCGDNLIINTSIQHANNRNCPLQNESLEHKYAKILLIKFMYEQSVTFFYKCNNCDKKFIFNYPLHAVHLEEVKKDNCIFDIASIKNGQILFAIEVWHTHKSNVNNRHNYNWIEVLAEDVILQKNKQHKNIPIHNFKCSCLIKTAKKLKFYVKSSFYSTYLDKKLDKILKGYYYKSNYIWVLNGLLQGSTWNKFKNKKICLKCGVKHNNNIFCSTCFLDISRLKSPNEIYNVQHIELNQPFISFINQYSILNQDLKCLNCNLELIIDDFVEYKNVKKQICKRCLVRIYKNIFNN